MKKFLFGLFAIALAIGFSAFTTTKTTNSTFATPYWYKVSAAGIVTSEMGFLTRAQAVIATGCSDAGTHLCARGYTSDIYNVGQLTAPTPNVIKHP